MEQDSQTLQVVNELQLDQLPEGTEIQVRPVPLAFAYKKLDPAVYVPLFGDVFSLGSIAIDPDGIRYVKGFAGCLWHPQGPSCLCMKPLCWLRTGRIHAPHPPPAEAAIQPAGPNEDIAMGVVGPAQQLDFQDNNPHAEPEMPNIEYGLGSHYPGPYVPAPGDYGQSTGSGDFGHHQASSVAGSRFAVSTGSDDVHHVFSALQMADKGNIQPPSQSVQVNHAVENELQEVLYSNLGPDSYTICFGQHGDGIPLTAIETLDDEQLSFEQDVSLGIKALIRFKFKYWQNIAALREYVDKRPQVGIRHGKDKTPISLREMARLVFSELREEMNTMAELKSPLCHGDLPVRIEDLVLLRIERIKSGTLQPTLALLLSPLGAYYPHLDLGMKCSKQPHVGRAVQHKLAVMIKSNLPRRDLVDDEDIDPMCARDMTVARAH
ncbi:hypothetical protein V8D89_002102 [Ganoderma adspersum]